MEENNKVNFVEDCKKYIEECEASGITFQEDLKRSIIQGAYSANMFNNPNYYAFMRLKTLALLLEEAKNKGWFNDLNIK